MHKVIDSKEYGPCSVTAITYRYENKGFKTNNFDVSVNMYYDSSTLTEEQVKQFMDTVDRKWDCCELNLDKPCVFSETYMCAISETKEITPVSCIRRYTLTDTPDRYTIHTYKKHVYIKEMNTIGLGIALTLNEERTFSDMEKYWSIIADSAADIQVLYDLIDDALTDDTISVTETISTIGNIYDRDVYQISHILNTKAGKNIWLPSAYGFAFLARNL